MAATVGVAREEVMGLPLREDTMEAVVFTARNNHNLMTSSLLIVY